MIFVRIFEGFPELVHGVSGSRGLVGFLEVFQREFGADEASLLLSFNVAFSFPYDIHRAARSLSFVGFGRA